MNQLFNIILIQPILNILVVLYHGLIFFHAPYALGFSIILLTIFIRLLLHPFTVSQIKTQKKMQELAPHLSKIKEKHKNDLQKQQSEQMALYKEHGVNPASGCLLLIIQLPLLIGLYQVLLKIVHLKSLSEINSLLYVPSLKITHLWDTTFFGLPLGKTPEELVHTVGYGILLVAITTGVLQFLQSKMMIVPPPAVDPAKKNLPAIKPEKKKDDFATAFQTQTTYLLPVMIGFFSFRFPLGLSLYWNTLTIFGIIQQYRIQGLGGLVGWFKKS